MEDFDGLSTLVLVLGGYLCPIDLISLSFSCKTIHKVVARRFPNYRFYSLLLRVVQTHLDDVSTKASVPTTCAHEFLQNVLDERAYIFGSVVLKTLHWDGQDSTPLVKDIDICIFTKIKDNLPENPRGWGVPPPISLRDYPEDIKFYPETYENEISANCIDKCTTISANTENCEEYRQHRKKFHKTSMAYLWNERCDDDISDHLYLRKWIAQFDANHNGFNYFSTILRYFNANLIKVTTGRSCIMDVVTVALNSSEVAYDTMATIVSESSFSIQANFCGIVNGKFTFYIGDIDSHISRTTTTYKLSTYDWTKIHNFCNKSYVRNGIVFDLYNSKKLQDLANITNRNLPISTTIVENTMVVKYNG